MYEIQLSYSFATCEKGKIYSCRMKSNRTILKKAPKFQIFVFLFLFAGTWISSGQNGCPQIPVSVLNGSNGFLV